MAPEIIFGKPYKGETVDLFAATIVLFMMYSGYGPFVLPHPTDNLYKLLCNPNQTKFFWKLHGGK